MDVSQLLDQLNDRQREAVAMPPQHAVVLAGAGSGKTLVLVRRIAWLIKVNNVSPQAILSVTFTNKAANEMRHRVESILEMPTRNMWVGTFHSLAHRLLRAHWQDAKLLEHFQILDSDDQHRLVKRVLKAMNLSEDQWQPKQVQWYINGKKDQGLRPADITHHGDFYTQKMVEIYSAYQQACEQSGLVDFAELLLRCHELWRDCPHLLAHYQRRFQHILVDEFQDTNTIQYSWLKQLVGKENILMVVGDDDQSIYGWRGAKIENIHKINHDFPNAALIRLEQNYRSTSMILDAANALIESNKTRLGKTLWTSGNQGEPIFVYSAYNELDEARYIVDCIKKWVNEGNRCDETAVLYRSNAQSRVIEEALIQANIPYRVYGGLRFFERMEIKNALAYLRLMVNREDDPALERIINTPTRGIGPTTVEQLREISRERKTSLWEAARFACEEKQISARAISTVKAFLDLIDQMAAETATFEPGEVTEQVLEMSGLLAFYRNEKSEQAQTRIENLEELVTASRMFRPKDDADIPLLQAFLSHAALESGDDQAERYQDSVQLMTLHSAKGLEFPLVFISGLEEGLFPHAMSADDATRLEEERRLCYVGITRAKRHLHFTYAELRRLHGREMYHHPSRFIQEIPKQLLQEVRLKAAVKRPYLSSENYSTSAVSSAPPGLRIGSQVRHKKFGDGIVMAYEGQGTTARVHVNFSGGSKWLLAPYVEQV